MEETPISINRKSLTVLVAEDDDKDRFFIKRAWDKSGFTYNLRFVEDGEELLEYLHHTGKYTDPESAPRPSIILLDLNMPRKTGQEALNEIKNNPKLRLIPIIVLTSSKAEEDICSSYAFGANSFIIKPVTVEALMYTLRVLEKYWIEIVKLPPENIEE